MSRHPSPSKLAVLDFARAEIGAPDFDVETSAYLTDHYVEINAIELIRISTLATLKEAGFAEPYGTGLMYPTGSMNQRVLSNVLAGMRGGVRTRLTGTGRLERRAVESLRQELMRTGSMRVRLIPGRMKRGHLSESE
jgi:hypothetical protein